MKAMMLKTVKLLGTSLVLTKGTRVIAEKAINQPSSKDKYFVRMPYKQDSILLNINGEFKIIK